MPLSSKKKMECKELMTPIIQYLLDTETVHPFVSEEEFNILYPEDKQVHIYDIYLPESKMDVKHLYLHHHNYPSNTDPRYIIQKFMSEWTFRATIKISDSEYTRIQGWFTSSASNEHAIKLDNGINLQIWIYNTKSKSVEIYGGMAHLKTIDGKKQMAISKRVYPEDGKRGFPKTVWEPIM
jgi:hypothetical protein